MIVCIYLPRFESAVAAGGAKALVAWEETIRALEETGAEVEMSRVGVAYFDAHRLQVLHRDKAGAIAAAQRAVNKTGRIGGGPTRFCALAAALQAPSRRARIVNDRAARQYLASQSVGLLAYREQTAALVAPLERLGILTLGDLAELSAGHVAARFGKAGTLARRLALGQDTPLQTRRVEDRLEESMNLSQSSSREALERALGALVDRLLAREERRGRTIRAVMLSARLVERGTWCELVVFRQAMADKLRMQLALAARLALLPAPAESLSLAVQAFGPATGDQGTLFDGERIARRERLRDAVSQIRMIAGHNAVLRALPVDPSSRVPERRYVFTPFSL
jgi:protein ImuB